MQASPHIKSFAAKHKDALIASAVFILSLWFVYLFSLLNFDTHHTGVMFRTALDVANGKILFRETFTQYGALTVWLQALSLLVLGRRVPSILFVTALFYAATYALFYLLARRFAGRALSLSMSVIAILLAPYLMWDFHPWASVFSLFFLLLTAYFLLRCETAKGWLTPALAGLCATLAFWCRQPVGLVAILACALIFLFFWLIAKKTPEGKLALVRLGFCGAGIAAGLVIFLVPLGIMGALPDFYHQSFGEMFTFTLGRSGYDNFGVLGMIGQLLFCLFLSPLDAPADIWHSYVWVILPVAAAFVAIAAAVRLARHKSGTRARRDRAVFIFSVIAAASWHQYYPVFCQRHWYWAALPCILPCVLLLRDLLTRLSHHPRLCAWQAPARRTLALCAAILLLFGTAVGYRAALGTQRLLGMRDMVRYENEEHPELNGLYLRPDVALHFDAMYANTDLLKALFPDRNIVNLNSNQFYDLLGEGFFHLYEDEVDSYYLHEDELIARYVKEHRPIVIFDEAPDDSYVLWRAAVGDHNDVWGWWHSLPADIYLPIELYEALPDAYK